MSSFLPFDVIRVINYYTDVGTTINFLCSCEGYSKLLNEVDFWSNKVEKEGLCDKDMFEEFVQIGNVIRKDRMMGLVDEISYSKNPKLIILFDELYTTFKDHKNSKGDIVSLLVTSVISLYKLFYQIKKWNKKCANNYCRSKVDCNNLSLPFCKYCKSCRQRHMCINGIQTIFHELVGDYKIITITYNNISLARDIHNNYLFSMGWNGYTKIYNLIGKLDGRDIIPVIEEDKQITKQRYINNDFVNFLV